MTASLPFPSRRPRAAAGRRSRIGSRRRSTQLLWVTLSAPEANVAAGATLGTILIPNTSGFIADRETTVLRVFGELYVYVPAAAAGTDWFAGIFTSRTDAGGGVTVLSPFAQGSADFLWHSTGHLIDMGGGHRYARVPVDSRSKRRLHDDDALICSVENLAGGAVVTRAWNLRVLLLVP